MKILIVGAGIGGLTLGAFLKEFGIDFEIIEKQKDFNQEGYSLGMWDNGRDILKKLGLSQTFDREGERIKYYILKNGKGRVLRKEDLSEFYTSYGSAYTHIDRSSLHKCLRDKVGVESIRLNTTISSIEQSAEGVEITLSDGNKKMYDCVVGADGVHSSVREMVFTEHDYEEYIAWRAWYCWIDSSFQKERSVIEFIEPKQFIAVFDDKDRTLAVLLAPTPHEVWDDVEGRVERLCSTFKDQTALVPKIFENIDAKNITPTDIAVVQMRRWYKHCIVLLGDAAHAMEPFGGLGGSMAMEDAYVLAGELFQAKENGKNLSEAFADYQQKRKIRVEKARRTTRNMRWWALRKSRLAGKLIQTILPFIPSFLFKRNFHSLLMEEL